MHLPAIHRSWPIQEILRLAGNSSSSEDFDHAKAAKLDHWKTCMMDDDILESCRNVTRRFPSEVAKEWCRSLHIPREPCIRLVMPYHPLMHRMVLKIARQVSELFEGRVFEVIGERLRITIATKNCGQHLVAKMRADNKLLFNEC